MRDKSTGKVQQKKLFILRAKWEQECREKKSREPEHSVFFLFLTGWGRVQGEEVQRARKLCFFLFLTGWGRVQGEEVQRARKLCFFLFLTGMGRVQGEEVQIAKTLCFFSVSDWLGKSAGRRSTDS